MAAALPAAAGGDEACGVGHRCRLRPSGPPQPAGVDPPRILSPEAAPRFGGGQLVELYGDATWSEGPV